MALILDGTNNRIEFPDGSTTDDTDVLVKVTYAENNNRQSANFYNNFNYWWEVSFSREKSDSAIRVSSLIDGQNNYCYPYYGTGTRLVAPNGTTYYSQGGSHYYHTKWDANRVPLFTEKLWQASELNNQTGSGWKVQFGWEHTGGGQCKPFEMINWNSNEDGRAWQRGSNCIIREYKQ